MSATATDVTPELMRQILDAIRLVIAAEATNERKVAAIERLVQRFPNPDERGTSSVRLFLDAITEPS